MLPEGGHVIFVFQSWPSFIIGTFLTTSNLTKFSKNNTLNITKNKIWKLIFQKRNSVFFMTVKILVVSKYYKINVIE